MRRSIHGQIISCFVDLIKSKKATYTDERGWARRLHLVTGLPYYRIAISQALNCHTSHVYAAVRKQMESSESLPRCGGKPLKKWFKESILADPTYAETVWVKSHGGNALFVAAKKKPRKEVIAEIAASRPLALRQDTSSEVAAVQERVTAALSTARAALDETVFVASMQVARRSLETLATDNEMSAEELRQYARDAHTHLSGMMATLGV